MERKANLFKKCDETAYSPTPLSTTGVLTLTLISFFTLSGIFLFSWAYSTQGQILFSFSKLSWLVFFVGAVLGGAAAHYLQGRPFWFTTLLPTSALIFAEFMGWTTKIPKPWILSILYFLFSSILVYLENKRRSSLNYGLIQSSLGKCLDPNTVNRWLRKPEALYLEPGERILTIMFAGITEFYRIAEKQSPKQAFFALRQIFSELTHVIQEHGGMVIQTTGHHLLAVFGYELDGSLPSQDHAHKALLCALKIQRLSLEKNLKAMEVSDPHYPLKIGINTAPVLIGDLNAHSSIEFTLIGHGVSFTKKLESTCDDYCIMMGALTNDMLLDFKDPGFTINKRFIQMKNFGLYYEAYEIDPLVTRKEDKNKVINAYRNFLGRRRRTQRWAIPPGVEIKVSRISPEDGTGSILNFSIDGLGLRFNRYLGVGSSFSLTLDNESGNLQKSLKSMNLIPLIAEVRWGRPESHDSFLMGVEIVNLSRQQREVLLKFLRATITHQLPETMDKS